ncbi:hypothetical protein B1M_02815, partial [Burkholderia sp. TJI49]
MSKKIYISDVTLRDGS